MAANDLQIGAAVPLPQTTQRDDEARHSAEVFHSVLRGLSTVAGGVAAGAVGGGSLQIAGRAVLGAIGGATGSGSLDDYSAQQEKLIQEQQDMNMLSEQFAMESNVMQSQHDTAMTIIRNIKGS